MGLEEDENKPDLEVVKTRLGLADAATLPWTFSEVDRKRLQVLTQVFFRTPLFRDELRDFLADPPARLAAVAKARQEESERLARGVPAGDLDPGRSHLGPAERRRRARSRGALEPRIRANAEAGAPARQRAPAARHARRGGVGADEDRARARRDMLRAAVQPAQPRGVAVVVAITPEAR